MRCTYALCDDPDNSVQFYTISKDQRSGGRDWSMLVGETLCKVCYNRFSRRGTLEKSVKLGTRDFVRRCTLEVSKIAPV
jgi:hypothetical protein